MKTKTICKYVSDSQKCYFDDWFKKLTENKQAIVSAYIKRVAAGGSKRNIKFLKDGLCEIKINSLSGLRIYFGEHQNQIILLLLGGDKKSQTKDILLAKRLWREYGKSKQEF